MIYKILKNNNGSAAIEFIIVILPCLILMFLFLNVLFIIGNLMLTQSSANRAIQQIAASGCLSSDLKKQIREQNSYLGVNNITIQAYSFNNSTESYDINKSSPNNIGFGNCNKKAASLSYVLINISYTQDVVLIPGVNSLNMDSEAVSIYSGYSR